MMMPGRTNHQDKTIFLMDILLRSNLPQTHIEIFNWVRLNLRLLTASDVIIYNSGDKLLPNLLLGKNHWQSEYNWPDYHELPDKWIEIFSNILRTTIATKLQSTPLGHWVHTGHQKWTHFLTTTGN